jgi:hypothetical protein
MNKRREHESRWDGCKRTAKERKEIKAQEVAKRLILTPIKNKKTQYKNL